MQRLFRLVIIICLVLSLFMIDQGKPVQAAGISYPIQINKSFDPIKIKPGATSKLSVTIYNPNNFDVSGATYTDTLPAGMTIVANPNANITIDSKCGSASLVPSGDRTNFTVSGATIPKQVGSNPGQCLVSMNVTTTVQGNSINTIPATSISGASGGGFSSITNTTPASATLQVLKVQSPSISKGFSPNTVVTGQASKLSITIHNNDDATTLTGVSVTDTLPTNVVISTPLTTSKNANCGPDADVAATTGGGSVTLTKGAIPPGKDCIFSVNVKSDSINSYINTILKDAATTNEGVTAPSSDVTATLNVQSNTPVITKVFSPNSINARDSSLLTVTIKNPTNATINITKITDTLPSTDLIVDASYPPVSTCKDSGNSTITPVVNSGVDPNNVSLSGSVIPAVTVNSDGTFDYTKGASCDFKFKVKLKDTVNLAGDQTYTNIIHPSDITGITYPTDVTDDLTIKFSKSFSGTKSFDKSTINNSGTTNRNSELTISINAPDDSNLTGFDIMDDFPAGVTVSNSSAPQISGCGALAFTPTAPSIGATSIHLTGGTILKRTTCSIKLYVTSSTLGKVTNSITSSKIKYSESSTYPPTALSADLTVVEPVTPEPNLKMSKAYYPDHIAAGSVSTLTISLENQGTTALTNLTLKDDTNASNVVIADTPLASTTCGGTLTAAAGTQIISLTGGTVPAKVGTVNGLCTIRVNVIGKAKGNFTNTINDSNVTARDPVQNILVSPKDPGEKASAILYVGDYYIGIVKGFDPQLVYGGSNSKLSIKLSNPNGVNIYGIAFSDTMPGEMIIGSPAALDVGNCGGTLSGNPGDNTFTFKDGSMASGTPECTMTLNVTMNTNGNLTNSIPAKAVTTLNGVTNPDRTDASLTDLPGASVSKYFTPNSVQSGAKHYSLLTIKVKNTGDGPLTHMGLIDDLPAGMLISTSAATAPAPVNNCGGTLAAVPGTSHIELSEGGTNGNAFCTLQIPVSATSLGSLTNTIPKGALKDNENISNQADASDTLHVIFDPPTGIKVFNDAGLPQLEWRMVWINSGNSTVIHTMVTDPIPAGTTYIPGTILCDARGTSTTTNCSFDTAANQILWTGNIGPDFGATDEASALNEIVITFRLTVPSTMDQVKNVGTATIDTNNDGLFTDETTSTSVSNSNLSVWNRHSTSGNDLPNTGFAPGITTSLPAQPAANHYQNVDNLWLEIPSIKVAMPIVGVPKINKIWDISWLGDKAGWLDGTAFPGTAGNSAITGHVVDANGKPGPFIQLGNLHYGDQVIVHAWGQKNVYEVRNVLQTLPKEMSSILKHESLPWVTLITCKGYNEKTGTYDYRLVIQAVLIKVEPEQ